MEEGLGGSRPFDWFTFKLLFVTSALLSQQVSTHI